MSGRHSWSRKGKWGGSKDVRTCEKCGMTAYKMGLFSGYRYVMPEDPLRREYSSDRMPTCPPPEPQVPTLE